MHIHNTTLEFTDQDQLASALNCSYKKPKLLEYLLGRTENTTELNKNT